MDPWLTDKNSEILDETQNEQNFSNSFEDNFKPTVSDTLPDSKQYLEALENRLRKLKSDPNVLRQLAEKREACMNQLLNHIYDQEYDTLDTPINSSSLLRTVAPERQALTAGELAELVKYDRLDIDEDSDHSSTSR